MAGSQLYIMSSDNIGLNVAGNGHSGSSRDGQEILRLQHIYDAIIQNTRSEGSLALAGLAAGGTERAWWGKAAPGPKNVTVQHSRGARLRSQPRELFFNADPLGSIVWGVGPVPAVPYNQ